MFLKEIEMTFMEPCVADAKQVRMLAEAAGNLAGEEIRLVYEGKLPE